MYPSFAAQAAARRYGRLVHVWLPEDAGEAHRLLVDLSGGQHRTAAASDYDRARFADVVGESGGFSHHPTGGPAPDDGWMASHDDIGDGAASVHDVRNFTPDHITAARQAGASRLAQPDNYQGGWVDRGTKKVYLDVSKHFPEDKEDDAREFALDQRQKAYYHVKDGDETFLHPQHDPQMLDDFDAWGKKYAARLKEGVPPKYRAYESLYPPSDRLQKHLDAHHEHMASLERDLMRARRRLR